MKSLALFALSVVATAAMAVEPADEIVINGNSTQAVSLTLSAVSNTANENTTALQNLASNSGNVRVRAGGNSTQAVVGVGSYVTNSADGYQAFANQNLSSNMGDVTIGGDSVQITSLLISSVTNTADGAHSKAVQNIASNNSCFGCPDRHSNNGPR
ncbi:hypothetical protein [Caenimonas soli]|uniref:hypothetical protein n=1 Tax=Caenimonas soli TaxID=2735555 RepID=UPI00155386E3|nr:hypothetical protein [Caenimonas soli]NPC55752.1 hypothetical protein [Caenimonas soli]